MSSRYVANSLTLSIVGWQSGMDVLMTDIEPAFAMLVQSVRLNGSPHNLQTQHVRWGANAAIEVAHWGRVDVVACADVIYNPTL